MLPKISKIAAGDLFNYFRIQNELQQTFNGSNTDGPFTTAVSNSFWSPLEKPQ